jgi:hypothetical protein
VTVAESTSTYSYLLKRPHFIGTIIQKDQKESGLTFVFTKDAVWKTERGQEGEGVEDNMDAQEGGAVSHVNQVLRCVAVVDAVV